MVEKIFKSDGEIKFLAHVGKNVKIFQNVVITKPEMISIGDYTRVDDFAKLEGGLGLKIGKYVHFSSYASTTGGGECEIGDFAGICQGSRIVTGQGTPFEEECDILLEDNDLYKRIPGKTVLGKYSFIGVNSVILKNVTVGEGAVVSAGSVVTKDVPPWSIVAGVPATIRGKRICLGKK